MLEDASKSFLDRLSSQVRRELGLSVESEPESQVETPVEQHPEPQPVSEQQLEPEPPVEPLPEETTSVEQQPEPQLVSEPQPIADVPLDAVGIANQIGVGTQIIEQATTGTPTNVVKYEVTEPPTTDLPPSPTPNDLKSPNGLKTASMASEPPPTNVTDKSNSKKERNDDMKDNPTNNDEANMMLDFLREHRQDDNTDFVDNELYELLLTYADDPNVTDATKSKVNNAVNYCKKILDKREKPEPEF
jgi:hypothetical protein